jgi:hypothetical protein
MDAMVATVGAMDVAVTLLVMDAQVAPDVMDVPVAPVVMDALVVMDAPVVPVALDVMAVRMGVGDVTVQVAIAAAVMVVPAVAAE